MSAVTRACQDILRFVTAWLSQPTLIEVAADIEVRPTDNVT
jgi:hypothetical protein